jgi:hypothetical protein
VEERAGERRFPTHPPPFMSQPWVTGDADLLSLKEFETVNIVTPRQFMELTPGD